MRRTWRVQQIANLIMSFDTCRIHASQRMASTEKLSEFMLRLLWLLVSLNSLALPYFSCCVSVMLFQEVWGKSFCRTIEKLVEVVQEYPGEVEHIFSPACVPLVRCAGCCGDENLECHPTLTSNTTMQVRIFTLVKHASKAAQKILIIQKTFSGIIHTSIHTVCWHHMFCLCHLWN